MIRQFFNMAYGLMLAKLILNDVPHALLKDTPYRTMYHSACWSSWEAIKNTGLMPQEVRGELGRRRGIFLWDSEAEARGWTMDEMVGMPVQHGDEWAFVVLRVEISPTALIERDAAFLRGSFLATEVVPPERIRALSIYELYPGAAEEYTRTGKYAEYPEYRPAWTGSTSLRQLPHPDSFRLERTTVDKVVGDLERTWHRIDSDMSIKMQSALSILKNVMGFYYEELAVVAWDNTNLVGIAVYKTTYDRDLQTQETNIAELASFTYEPGIGELLVGEAIKIAQEEKSSVVTVWHGPGVRGFYERLGFVTDVRHPEIPTSMVYELTKEKYR